MQNKHFFPFWESQRSGSGGVGVKPDGRKSQLLPKFVLNASLTRFCELKSEHQEAESDLSDESEYSEDGSDLPLHGYSEEDRTSLGGNIGKFFHNQGTIQVDRILSTSRMHRQNL